MPKDDPFVAYFDCGGEYGYDFDVREYIPEHMALVDRARFERLRRAVEIMDRELTEKHGWTTRALFHPGDRDPLP